MRKLLAVALILPPSALLFAACGGDDSTTAGAPDAATEQSLPDKRPVPPDTSTNADSASTACAPGDVSSFMPSWVPPVTPDPNACTDQQIKDFFAACYDSKTRSTPACQAWIKVPANKACFGCLDTPDTATVYGVLIEHKGYVTANTAGCEAIVTKDLTGNGCAAKTAAEGDCTHAACETNCPLTSDPQSFTDFSNCLNNAGKTSCKTYVAALCVDAGADLSACGPFNQFSDYYFSMAPLFCGGKPAADAGSDASTDSGADAADATGD